MKVIRFFILFVVLSFKCFAQQDSIKMVGKANNPIIFGESFVGISSGFLYGANLNFQVKNSLFTVRYMEMINIDAHIVNPFVPIPYLELKQRYYEPSVLYGYRYIKNGHSLSLSLGLSYNRRKIYNPDDNIALEKYTYIGFPYEVNFKFFNSVKRRYRVIYGLLPIGKPTPFSRSIGFKLIGNVSKFSYFGAGITYGLGYHKIYEQEGNKKE